MLFTTTQKIIKIGSSKGAILPAKALKELNAHVGDNVKITIESVQQQDPQAELMHEYQAFVKQYGATLKNLSER